MLSLLSTSQYNLDNMNEFSGSVKLVCSCHLLSSSIDDLKNSIDRYKAFKNNKKSYTNNLVDSNDVGI